MATAAKRVTVYLDPELHKALRLKAVETSQSVSELVNRAVRKALSENPLPSGCENLTGQERYSIQDEEGTVWVVKVGHRKDIHR